MKTLTLLLLFFSVSFLSAQTITVKQDGTGMFTKIQDAIDVAWPGDTILVYPGVYYENLTVEEKGIVLGSLTLTTGDNSYIRQTVIDGGRQGRCLYVRPYPDTSFVINGFEIRNGSTTRGGGGIYFDGHIDSVFNCYIHHNRSGYGGGIMFYYGKLFLSNVTITYNNAEDGGGIKYYGGALEFDSVNLCNIYCNYASSGTDLSYLYTVGCNMIVDTFTVLNPDKYYIRSYDSSGVAQDSFLYNINVGKIQPVANNLYVAPYGDNENSGLNPDEPLKNIYYALLKMKPDTLNPDTIFIANGTYSDTLSGDFFPLGLKDSVSLVGESRESVVLDAEGKSRLLYASAGLGDYVIKNLTLSRGYEMGYRGGVAAYLNENSNVTFENIAVMNCRTDGRVAGIFLVTTQNALLKDVVFKNNEGKAFGITRYSSSDTVYSILTTIQHCVFENNTPNFPVEYPSGGAVYISGVEGYADSTKVIMINSLFKNNYSISGGISLHAEGADVDVINCTFADNKGSMTYSNANVYLFDSKLKSFNSIFYNNSHGTTYYEMKFFNWNDTASVSIYNSLVDGGVNQIIHDSLSHLYYDESNISLDPLFVGNGDYPYSLSFESPCIDAGTLDLPDYIELPEFDLAGNPRIFNNRIDMGAYEWDPTLGMDETARPLSGSATIAVSPNPFFNRVSFVFNSEDIATVDIYNGSGRKIKSINNRVSRAGKIRVTWDGRDTNGNILPPGVYFVVVSSKSSIIGTAKIIKL